MLAYLNRRVTGLHNPQGGGSSGGGGSSTTVQEIPAELKPLASRYTKEATKMFDTPFQSYDNQRYADLNPTQYASLGMTADRALNGSATMDNAESNLNSLMSGSSNPYLAGMVKQAQDSVSKNAIQGMVGSGSFGNSGLNEAYTKGMGDVATNMYGNAYAQDRANQLQAIGMAPTFANQKYTDANALMGAGQVMQDQEQQQQDFNYEEFMRKLNLPYQNQAAAAGVFGTNLGGSSKTESTQSGGGK